MTTPTMTQIALCSALEHRWKELQQEEQQSQKAAKTAHDKLDYHAIIEQQKQIQRIGDELDQIESTLVFYDDKFDFANFSR